MPPTPLYDNAKRATIVMDENVYAKAKDLARRQGDTFSRWAAITLAGAVGAGMALVQMDRRLYEWVQTSAKQRKMETPEFLTAVLIGTLQNAYDAAQKPKQ